MHTSQTRQPFSRASLKATSIRQQTHLQHHTPEGSRVRQKPCCVAVASHWGQTQTHVHMHTQSWLPAAHLSAFPSPGPDTALTRARHCLSSMVNQPASLQSARPCQGSGEFPFASRLCAQLQGHSAPALFILEAAYLYVSLSDTDPDLP